MILPTNSGHGTKRVNSQSEVAHMTKSASINKSHANNTRLNFVKKPLSWPNVSVWPLPPVNSAFTIPSSTNNCTRQYPLRESAQAAEIAVVTAIAVQCPFLRRWQGVLIDRLRLYRLTQDFIDAFHRLECARTGQLF